LNGIIIRYKTVKPFEFYNDIGIIAMDEKDKDWLIEQAEKVEQLEQEIEHLQDELARWEAGLNQTKEMYELQRQLRQAQEKIDQLKEWDAIRRDKIVQLEEQFEEAQAKAERLQIKLNSIRFYVENPVPDDKLAEIILNIINDHEHDGI
jgi:DNA repair exonuclease SbcCD ATPase subunit